MLTRWIGHPLIQLNFDQQRYEADFRFSMVRLRENAENVAFYGGEAREFDTFRARFANVIANWWGIIRRRKKLTWFTTGYSQLAIIFPFVVAAPRYFDKAIQLGGLMQISSAFGQVQDSLSFIITSYTEIAEYQAVVQRLSGFSEKMNEIAADRRAPQPIEIEQGGSGVEVDSLDLNLPDGRMMRPNISLSADRNNALLITGASGLGKSTLLRAVAGIWPFGRGEISLSEKRILFLPQRPYLPLGTLADTLLYPLGQRSRGNVDSRNEKNRLPLAQLTTVLEQVGLRALAGELETMDNWTQRLSLGEQQRLAFARILLSEPSLVFLDEATSALDERSEAQLYTLLRAAPWRPTIVSVGHRRTLRDFHDQILDIVDFAHPFASTPARLSAAHA